MHNSPFDDADVLDAVPGATYRALADERRRRVLYLLLENDRLPVAELADVLSAWEADGIATPDDRDPVAVDLRHVHLPKLAAAGLIGYDDAADRVERRDLRGPVRQLLLAALRYESDVTAEESP
ncbi:transcriptional regulator [Halobacteriales archaeon QS_1_68_17]|nr:MAG: transcriptional regulator [Halobacteriales archaeon QS_1_68_17]